MFSLPLPANIGSKRALEELDGAKWHSAKWRSMKPVVYSSRALKSLQRIPADLAKRIRAKIEQYAVDAASQANNVTKLQGRPGLRLRVGDWRVIFDDSGAVLDVLEIGPRGGVYDQ